MEHLVENAVKYAPPGDVDVIVDVPTDGATTVLRVVDRGPGLPVDVDVFAPFERGQTGTDGTGLGLHIVRSLVESMGGHVDGHSTPDGAEFRVELPRG